MTYGVVVLCVVFRFVVLCGVFCVVMYCVALSRVARRCVCESVV